MARWASLTAQQQSGVLFALLLAVCKGGWAPLKGRLRAALGLPAVAAHADAAAEAAPPGIPAQASAALLAALDAAKQRYMCWCVEQGLLALETNHHDPRSWLAALRLLAAGGKGGEALQVGERVPAAA